MGQTARGASGRHAVPPWFSPESQYRNMQPATMGQTARGASGRHAVPPWSSPAPLHPVLQPPAVRSVV
eukprot:8559953-Alexandrium_andersonii.AAC.1